MYKRQVVGIDPLGHDIRDGERVEPTCTEDGYAVGKCGRAGCDYEGKTILPKLGHDMKIVEHKAATCSDVYKRQLTHGSSSRQNSQFYHLMWISMDGIMAALHRQQSKQPINLQIRQIAA